MLHKASGDDGMGGEYSVSAKVTDFLHVEMYDEDWNDFCMYTSSYMKFRLTGEVRDCLEEDEESRTVTNTAVFEAMDFDPVTDEAEIAIAKPKKSETDEPENPVAPVDPDPTNIPENPEINAVDDVPDTGDESKGLIVALAMLILSAGGAGLAYFRKLPAF